MPYKVSDINPAKTALIIVDMENDFVAEGAPLRVKTVLAVVPPLESESHNREASSFGVVLQKGQARMLEFPIHRRQIAAQGRKTMKAHAQRIPGRMLIVLGSVPRRHRDCTHGERAARRVVERHQGHQRRRREQDRRKPGAR